MGIVKLGVMSEGGQIIFPRTSIIDLVIVACAAQIHLQIQYYASECQHLQGADVLNLSES